ncbi:hypothetical protein BTN49_2153 [Candidatus Enterovibrio escicola]|uniref:Transposase DDE domain-containing protein n=1 Tax=Candidatus Enterovibrio escicola TaxID=1927127 RepID=A0A2A5T2A3_9GAMM|nr:hypothetical protein BTN49_2153 [Candidatus Enterovibrio escacola]
MGVKRNMKLKVMKLWDYLILRKLFIKETVFDQLKNTSQKLIILGTVIISSLWLICWRGLSPIHFNQRNRVSR